MRTTVTTALGEAWLRADTYSATSVDPKRPFIGTQYLGYSEVSKRYVTVNVNNFGGYWIEESPGWNGSRLVWTDQSTEDGERGITTITRLSGHSYRVHEDLTRNGKPEKAPADAVCTRASNALTRR